MIAVPAVAAPAQQQLLEGGVYAVITRAQILGDNPGKQRACREGQALFESLRKMQGREDHVLVRLDTLTQMWMAQVFGGFYCWLREAAGLLPQISAARADLTGADLKGADLTGADLTGAYLKGADLTGAYLKGAYLKGAYLTGADLKGAYLKGADLKGAYRPKSNYWIDDLPAGWERTEGGLLVPAKPQPAAVAAPVAAE